MPRGASVVNLGRGGVIDDDALLEALDDDHLAGAALDVFGTEPPAADDPLLACPNVIATPHIGGDTVEVAAHQGQLLAADLARLLRGERPQHIRNPEVLPQFSWTAPRRELSREAVRQLTSGAGPAVTDLEAQATAPAPKRGGMLAGLRRALGGKGPTSAAPAAPVMGEGGAAQLARLLQAFTERIRTDPGMHAFAEGKHVLMHFLLNDVGASFYLNFQDGEVEAALGDPPVKPDVTLKMSAETLDGVFRGRINGMRAAMSGRLAFSGDTTKAMAFQRIQKDLGALYMAASEAVGGPGELTALAAPAGCTCRRNNGPCRSIGTRRAASDGRKWHPGKR